MLSANRILITRPAHQAGHLCQLVAGAGGIAVRLPLLATVPFKPPCFPALSTVDIAVFVSPNAVQYALSLLPNPLPSGLRLVAVGQKTADVVAAQGWSVLRAPPPYNSEALLTLPEFQWMADQHVVIFRGENGRELLAETLRQRGATVTPISVYQRICPPLPSGLVVNQPFVDIITLTSVEAADNLFFLLKSPDWLYHTPFAVFSSRIAEALKVRHIHAPVFVADEASDEALLEAVLAWQRSKL